VGLVQRQIEAAGFTTITLSNIPDLTASVGAPRTAAIEHPFGLNVGLPGDAAGQRAVLRATLGAIPAMDKPGSIQNLPFEWIEPAEKLNTHPSQLPPISQYIIRHPWAVARLINRNPPDP
jgi:hypothetical protein